MEEMCFWYWRNNGIRISVFIYSRGIECKRQNNGKPFLLINLCFPTVRYQLFIIFRASPREAFLGKDVLKIWSKFTGGHACRGVISIKLLCNFIEITLRYGCSPVHLVHNFRAFFPNNTSEGLHLYPVKAIIT